MGIGALNGHTVRPWTVRPDRKGGCLHTGQPQTDPDTRSDHRQTGRPDIVTDVFAQSGNRDGSTCVVRPIKLTHRPQTWRGTKSDPRHTESDKIQTRVTMGQSIHIHSLTTSSQVRDTQVHAKTTDTQPDEIYTQGHGQAGNTHTRLGYRQA